MKAKKFKRKVLVMTHPSRESQAAVLSMIARGSWAGLDCGPYPISARATLKLKVGKKRVLFQGRVEDVSSRGDREWLFYPAPSATQKAIRIALRGMATGFAGLAKAVAL